MFDDNGKQIVKVHHCPKVINMFKDKEIAYIGPSPTLLGKGFGEKINQHDLVCRSSHNLCHEDQKKDYGSRCDVLFHHNGSKTILEYKKEFLDIMQVEIPKAFIGCRMAKKIHALPNHPKQLYHDLIRYYSQAMLTHPKLKDIYVFHFGNGLQHSVTEICVPKTNCNSGLYALFGLLSLPVKKIWITGFDFYQGIITGKEQYLKTKPEWDDHILWQRVINPDYTDESLIRAREGKLVETTHHDQIPQIKLFYWLTKHSPYKDKIEIGEDLEMVLDRLDKEEAKQHFPHYEFIWEITNVPDYRYHYDF